jgi:hypothetical protein
MLNVLNRSIENLTRWLPNLATRGKEKKNWRCWCTWSRTYDIGMDRLLSNVPSMNLWCINVRLKTNRSAGSDFHCLSQNTTIRHDLLQNKSISSRVPKESLKDFWGALDPQRLFLLGAAQNGVRRPNPVPALQGTLRARRTEREARRRAADQTRHWDTNDVQPSPTSRRKLMGRSDSAVATKANRHISSRLALRADVSTSPLPGWYTMTILVFRVGEVLGFITWKNRNLSMFSLVLDPTMQSHGLLKSGIFRVFKRWEISLD